MRHRLAILATLLVLGAGTAAAQGSAICERNLRQCIAECASASGPCTQACYGERAQCIQNPSRPPQPRSASR